MTTIRTSSISNNDKNLRIESDDTITYVDLYDGDTMLSFFTCRRSVWEDFIRAEAARLDQRVSGEA